METANADVLRAAVIAAHEMYGHGGCINDNDLEVANYDDEESFVEGVDQGFWVEARVWVPDEAIENEADAKFLRKFGPDTGN